MRKIISILVAVIIIIGCLGLLMSYAATIVFADEGYPAPIEEYGYPIDAGYPVAIEGYSMDPSYPGPVQMSENTFIDAVKIEIETVKQVIEEIPLREESGIYVTVQQLNVIVKYYYGNMIAWAR